MRRDIAVVRMHRQTLRIIRFVFKWLLLASAEGSSVFKVSLVSSFSAGKYIEEEEMAEEKEAAGDEATVEIAEGTAEAVGEEAVGEEAAVEAGLIATESGAVFGLGC